MHLVKTHNTLGWTSLDEGSPRRRDLYLHNTQHSQEKDIHVSGGIRTLIPSNSAAADPRLRPRGHRDRLSQIFQNNCPLFSFFITILPALSYSLLAFVNSSASIIIISFHYIETQALELQFWEFTVQLLTVAKESVCSLISEILLIKDNLLIAFFLHGTFT